MAPWVCFSLPFFFTFPILTGRRLDGDSSPQFPGNICVVTAASAPEPGSLNAGDRAMAFRLQWPPQGDMRRCGSLFLCPLCPGLILGILEVPKPIVKGSRFQKIAFDPVAQFSLRRGAVNALGCFLGVTGLARMPELSNRRAPRCQHASGTKVLHTYASTELRSRFQYYFYICFKCQEVRATSSEEPNLRKLWSRIYKWRAFCNYASVLPTNITDLSPVDSFAWLS